MNLRYADIGYRAAPRNSPVITERPSGEKLVRVRVTHPLTIISSPVGSSRIYGENTNANLTGARHRPALKKEMLRLHWLPE